MDKVLIVREGYTDQGTFGRLYATGLVLRTLELPWRENRTGISCIPVGVYNCHLRYSPRFKKCLYEVQGVPGRSAILIHAANFAGDRKLGFRSELNGCIALGLGMINQGQLMITNSRVAVNRLHSLVQGEDFQLEIKEAKV